MRTRIIALILALGVVLAGYSQKGTSIERLKVQLQSQQLDDSIKVDCLNGLSKLFYRLDVDSSHFYATEALKLSQKIGYQFGTAESYKNLGFSQIPRGHYDSAKMYFESSLALSQDLSFNYLSSEVYNGIGIYSEESGRYRQALEAYYNSLAIKSAIGDVAGQGKIHNNLGQAFRNIGELDSAMTHLLAALDNENFLEEYNDWASTHLILGMVRLSLERLEESKKSFRMALSKLKLPDHTIKIASSNAGLGRVHLKQGNLDSTKYFLRLASRQFQTLDHLGGLANTTSMLAETFRAEGRCDSALLYYQQSLRIRRTANNHQYLAREMTDMSRCLIQQGSLDSALRLTTSAAKLAAALGSKVEAWRAYSLLHEIYSQKREYKRAYEMVQLGTLYKDSISSQARINEINRLENEFEISNIQKEQELYIAEVQAEELRLRWLLIGTAVGICLLVVVSLILYNSLKRKRRDHALIARKNEKIRLVNESLEELVKEHTEKVQLQSEKLKNYAFSNSHEVRAPLARLLGLVNLWDDKAITPNDRDFLIQNISKSALELDEVVRKLNEVLKDEDMEP